MVEKLILAFIARNILRQVSFWPELGGHKLNTDTVRPKMTFVDLKP